MQENFGELKHEVTPGAVKAEKEQVEQNTTPEQAPEQTLETSVSVETSAPASEVESTPETAVANAPVANQDEVTEFLNEAQKPTGSRAEQIAHDMGRAAGLPELNDQDRKEFSTNTSLGGTWIRTMWEWFMRKGSAKANRE